MEWWRPDRFPCIWLICAFRGAICDSVWEKRGQIGNRWWWPRSVVKIGARPCMAGDRRGGSVMREGWAEIWLDRCLWVLGVWPALDLGDWRCVKVAAEGDSA